VPQSEPPVTSPARALSSAEAIFHLVARDRFNLHVASDQSWQASTTYVTEGVPIRTVDGTLCDVTNKGSLSNPNFIVPNIFFVPDLSMDPLSVGQVTDHNYFVEFDDSSCLVQDRRTRGVNM
jgi:hypothetical protein